jgi:hypothetical protein
MVLSRLSDILEAEDEDWRENVIICLDNARYHKGRILKQMIE